MAMLLHFGKCKCLHAGHRNLDVKYKMGDTVECTTIKEKDSGLTISADFKFHSSMVLQLQKVIKFLG